MTPDRIFVVANTAVLPFWLLYIFAPRWRVSRWLAAHHVGPALVALVYAVLLGPMIPQLLVPEAPKLDVLLGMMSPRLFTIVWLHLLALDLLAGEWMLLDSLRRGVPLWLGGVLRYLTLMMGPFGVLLYLLVRLRWPAASEAAVPAT